MSLLDKLESALSITALNIVCAIVCIIVVMLLYKDDIKKKKLKREFENAIRQEYKKYD
jgi:hypothetical protein